MKHLNKLRLALCAAAVVVAVAFFACNKEKEQVNIQQSTEADAARKSIATFDNTTGQMIYALTTKETESSCIEENGEKGIGIPFSWEWYRKKYNCKRGFGICNFYIGKPRPVVEDFSTIPNDNDYNTTYLQFDSRGDCFVELCIVGNESFDDVKKSLFVDEDICVLGPDGLFYLINEGVYPLNSQIGSKGGYRIPIQRFQQ